MSQKHNIVIEQGTTFVIQFALEHSNGVVFDTNTYVANATIKRQYESNSYYNFDTQVSNSVVTISMAASTTDTIPYGRYYYDVLIISTEENLSIRIVEGIADVKPQISKWSYGD